MKIITKQEEEENYSETVKGGAIGGTVGLLAGIGGLYFAGLRYPVFRQITVPLRFFLVSSSATFGAIVTADHFSRAYEFSRNPDAAYRKEAEKAREEEYEKGTAFDKFMSWGQRHRYQIVGGSWAGAMALSLGLVGRSPYLTTAQKLVQARVYAQSLTIAVLIVTALFEIGDQQKGEGRWETIQVVDRTDPEHEHWTEKKVERKEHKSDPVKDQWKDMVEAEEERNKQKEKAVRDQVLKDEKSGKYKPKDHKKKHKKAEKKSSDEKKKDSDEGTKDSDEEKSDGDN